MTEFMPSSIQPNQAAQKPTICCRLSGVYFPIGIASGAIPPAVPLAISVSSLRTFSFFRDRCDQAPIAFVERVNSSIASENACEPC
jgi:hypothetical protein